MLGGGSMVSGEMLSLSGSYLGSILDRLRKAVVDGGRSVVDGGGSVVFGGGVVVVLPVTMVRGGRVYGTSGMSEDTKVMAFLCGYLGGVHHWERSSVFVVARGQGLGAVVGGGMVGRSIRVYWGVRMDGGV